MLNLYEWLRLNIYFQRIWFILKKGGKSLPYIKKKVFKNVKNFLKKALPPPPPPPPPPSPPPPLRAAAAARHTAACALIAADGRTFESTAVTRCRDEESAS